ncbi:MAG TPA: DUF192 domain-containing protein [Steroidobacteraceae bacterium]|nr:DUF192 domain-containing protein [Steroidobacteraceae bacterium]
MRPNWLAPACAALALGAAAAARAQSPPILDLATYPRAALEIVQPAKPQPRRFHFDVWVADTEPRAEQGLMFVRDLPAGSGMVFPLQPPRVEAMWMKNTYIELDMLFIAVDGHVSKIIERARPLSLDTLSSDRPVRAVLELKGGEAQRLGLRVGDLVTWKVAGGSPR